MATGNRDRLVGMTEAARILHVSRRTMERISTEGLIDRQLRPDCFSAEWLFWESDLRSLDFLRIGQVARCLGVHKHTLRRWFRQYPEIDRKEYYMISNFKRYNLQDVEVLRSWMFRHGKKPRKKRLSSAR